jgi:acyl carrier protein
MENRADAVLRQAWISVLGVLDVADGTSFFDEGGDSFMAIRMMEDVEAALPIQFPIEVLFMDGSYAALVTECEQRLSAAAG